MTCDNLQKKNVLYLHVMRMRNGKQHKQSIFSLCQDICTRLPFKLRMIYF